MLGTRTFTVEFSYQVRASDYFDTDLRTGHSRKHGLGMATDISYPHIEKPENEPARLRRLPRIRIAQIVMDYLSHGWSADEMCRQHPHLSIAEAHAAMAYYFDHQEQVDTEIREEFQAAQASRKEQPDSPFITRLRAQGII